MKRGGLKGATTSSCSVHKSVTSLKHCTLYPDGRITKLPAKPADLMHAIGCPEFISTIFCLSDVLSLTLPVSKNLQNEGIEYTGSASVITDAISVLQQRRTDCQHFHDVFEAASKAIQVLNVSVTTP